MLISSSNLFVEKTKLQFNRDHMPRKFVIVRKTVSLFILGYHASLSGVTQVLGNKTKSGNFIND